MDPYQSDDDEAPTLVQPEGDNSSVNSEDAVPDLVPTNAADSPQEKVPITIVTGYLGAGKSTLLDYILTAQHGKKIAVILNEFGDSIDIEKQVTISDVNSTEKKAAGLVPLANGCICCSLKDIGVAAIENLVEHGGDFDYILLETTGLADPGNIAPLFWLDDGLGSNIFLDGIVTLVDAKNILKSLDEGYGDENATSKDEEHGHDAHGPLLTTAHLQISHADVILINKSDLVSEQELNNVTERIRSINGLARIEITSQSRPSQLDGLLLNIHAYDEVTDADLKFASKGHSHLDPTISTTTINFPALSKDQVDSFDRFLRTVLWEETLPDNMAHESFEIHRLKGRIPVVGGNVLIVQGVRNLYDTNEGKSAQASGNDQAKLVLIGRGVDQPAFRDSLIATLSG